MATPKIHVAISRGMTANEPLSPPSAVRVLNYTGSMYDGGMPDLFGNTQSMHMKGK